jgi:hypothetical protein
MNPRTFLALHVVFGRACGAASTTFSRSLLDVEKEINAKTTFFYSFGI